MNGYLVEEQNKNNQRNQKQEGMASYPGGPFCYSDCRTLLSIEA
jgi:hypothetical protein